MEGLDDGLPMINEPMHDFSQAPQREKFAQAVAKVKVPGRRPHRRRRRRREGHRHGGRGLPRLARPRPARSVRG